MSAEAYDRHVGRYSRQLASALIDFAGIEPGMSAVDVGCGPGAMTTVLVERLGTAKVRAADPSEPFVEACRARQPGVEVVVADAEALPFANGSADAALTQLVVNFALRDRYRHHLGVGDGPFELTARAWAVAGIIGEPHT